jgi:hypothetical protein
MNADVVQVRHHRVAGPRVEARTQDLDEDGSGVVETLLALLLVLTGRMQDATDCRYRERPELRDLEGYEHLQRKHVVAENAGDPFGIGLGVEPGDGVVPAGGSQGDAGTHRVSCAIFRDAGLS